VDIWSRIVGPSATRTENAGTLGLALLGGAVAPALSRHGRPPSDGERPAVLTLSLLAVDLWGGAWCNNTPAAARWYHREGQGRSQHIRFAVAHLHPFLIAWLDRDRDTTGRSRLVWALSLYGYLVGSTVVVASLDRRAQRVAAVTTTVGGILLDRLLGPSTRAPWFAPVFFVKLLTGHAGGAAALPVDPLGR
jgi:hypothetical protein